ncbi:MAG: PAS domain S-box protein, partial [Candidatus Heimdallarchaeota archaeon]
MKSTNKTKDQLLKEVKLLKTKIARLQKPGLRHKLEDKALQESEERYSSIVESLFIGIVIHIDNKIAYANKTIVKMLGYISDKQLIGRSVLEFVHPEDQEKVMHAIEGALVSTEPPGDEAPTVIEERLIKKDGSQITIKASAILINYYGETALMVMINDVTKRKQAETALQLKEARFSTLISNLPGMAYLCKNDKHWTMLYVNDTCTQLTGYKPIQLIGNEDVSYNELIHPDDREFVRQHVEKAISLREHFELEYRIISATGEEKWVWERGIHNISKNNGEELIEGLIIDISERKKAGNELHESNERYRLLFENSPIGIFSLNREGKIIEANAKLLQLLGSPSLKETKKINAISFPPVVKSGISAAIQRCFTTGESISDEAPYMSKWGKSTYVHYRVTPNCIDKGKVISVQLMFEDITNRKLVEKKVNEKSLELEKQIKKSEEQRIATLSLLSDLNETTKELKVEINERKQAEGLLMKSENQLRQLTKYMDTKNEDEKKRIATEIHDGLGQLLTGLQMDIQWIAKKWPKESTLLKNKFVSMNNIIDAAVKETQKLSFQIRPKMLDELGLLETLQSEARQFEERTGIYCNVQFKPNNFDVEYHRSSTIY